MGRTELLGLLECIELNRGLEKKKKKNQPHNPSCSEAKSGLFPEVLSLCRTHLVCMLNDVVIFFCVLA